MRIAIVTEVFLPKIDGVVTRLTGTLEQLAQLGHEVLIFAPGNPPDSFAGFDVVRLPSVPFWPVYPEIHVGLPSLSAARRLRAFHPDVVHAVNPMWTAGFATLYAHRCGFPVVASFHTDVPEYTTRLGIGWVAPIARRALRSFHSRARLNLVTSAPMVNKARAYGIGNVSVWPKAVDTLGFHPAKRSAQVRALLTGGNSDDPLVTYVGRISAEKDVARTVRIMEEVRAHVPTARLALVGEGPQYEQLRESISHEWVVFTGYLSGEKLRAAFASGDVFLFPSATETLGFVALESFASGVPVVGADAGGVPYVIDEGKTGFLVDPDAADAVWAERVVRVLLDAPLRHEMGQAARREALRWSWRAATEKLVEVYAAAAT